MAALRWRGLLVVLTLGLLVASVAACGAAPTPTPTATPKPTPSPTPSPSVQELMERMTEALLDLKTVRFSLTHLEGGTDLGIGLLLTDVEGEAAFPERARLDARAVVSGLRVNVAIGIVQIGEKAFLQDPVSRSWREVDPGSLPFLFAGMNRSVAKAMAVSEEVTLVGTGELDGAPVYILNGTVPSEALRGLVPAAVTGERLQWELVIGQVDSLARRLRLQGVLVSGDTPEMERVLSLSSFDSPVTIEPPL